jgi:hypothetical protein
MFWFGRPSRWRWVGAGLLILGALVTELWPSRQVLYPFAAAATPPGDPFEVEWRPMPAGLYVPPEITGRVAAHRIEAGDPIRDSDLAAPIAPPRDWWALSLEVPLRLAPGTPTRLVITGAGEPVPGLVVTSSDPDRFSATGPTALIAVPEADAPAVAAAAAARQVVVLVAP